MILTLLAAITGALAVFVAVSSLTGQFSYSHRRLASRTVALQRHALAPERDTKPAVILKEDLFAGNKTLARFLRRFAWASSRARLLDRADLPLKVAEYLLILVATFAVLLLLATLASGLLLVGLGFGIGGVVIVEVWLRKKAQRRLAHFNKQLPIALQVMSTSLKSGFGTMEAVATVSREMDPPIADEFERILDEARVGGSFEDGVHAIVERLDSADLRIVARALEIHRKVGGDLAAILDSVGQTMREREELRGHVLALTAQQRMGGVIVALLPLWVIGFFSVTDPDFISPLWTEPVGRLLLAGAGALEVVAFFVMRRILSIEV